MSYPYPYHLPSQYTDTLLAVFIAEITARAFIVADANKRRTLSRADIAKALSKSDQFDFLIDIVPRDDLPYAPGGGGGGGGGGSKQQLKTEEVRVGGWWRGGRGSFGRTLTDLVDLGP